MAIDLSTYDSIGTGLFVRIEVDYYKTSPEATPTSTVLRFSDFNRTVVVNGETYTPLGNLVGITSTTSELKNSSDNLTITISGIPDTSIAEIVNSRIKGCPVQIWRMMFNPNTLLPLSIPGNPVGRFFGMVTNYALDEQYDVVNRSSSNTISLICSSKIDILSNKVAGRKTNPNSEKRFYPSDTSMDRVPNLVGANFNFGVPK